MAQGGLNETSMICSPLKPSATNASEPATATSCATPELSKLPTPSTAWRRVARRALHPPGARLPGSSIQPDGSSMRATRVQAMRAPEASSA